MKQTLKNFGFTLIELLVVIVILGILSTISVGTFRSYFAKARDAERVSAIQNIAMMIKVDSGGSGDCSVYNYTDGACLYASAAALAELAIDNDYGMPTVRNGLNYYYVFLPRAGDDNHFFIAVGAEEDNAANGINVTGDFSIYADGTTIGMETAPNCVWTNGNIFSCPDVGADSWEIMALTNAGGGGGGCSASNCAACTSFVTCQTPCIMDWVPVFDCHS